MLDLLAPVCTLQNIDYHIPLGRLVQLPRFGGRLGRPNGSNGQAQTDKSQADWSLRYPLASD